MTSWANTPTAESRRARTRPALEARLAKYEQRAREMHPGVAMSEADVVRLADLLFRRDMVALSARAMRARRLARQGKGKD